MPIICLGKKGTPLDWSAFQDRAARALGRRLHVPSVENGFLGDTLSRSELHAMGFKIAANPGLYQFGQALRVPEVNEKAEEAI